VKQTPTLPHDDYAEVVSRGLDRLAVVETKLTALIAESYGRRVA
jgi:hypothetical protein